ncbi:uncharacterized protein LOC144581762 [Callithrix jacchus]
MNEELKLQPVDGRMNEHAPLLPTGLRGENTVDFATTLKCLTYRGRGKERREKENQKTKKPEKGKKRKRRRSLGCSLARPGGPAPPPPLPAATGGCARAQAGARQRVEAWRRGRAAGRGFDVAVHSPAATPNVRPG